MITTLGFAVGASLLLLAGTIVAMLWRPPRWLVAVALAFATGALISAVSFELFEESYTRAARCGPGSSSWRGRPCSP
jgi:ZIP family zinc transporter